MILTEKRYRKERGNTEGTYQSFYLTEEIEEKRNYVTLEIGHLTRWRTRKEVADYLRWIADSILEE